MPQGVRLCPACAGASGTHVCSARHLQPPPFQPCVSARHLLYPSLAFHARCPTLYAIRVCPTLGCSLSWFPPLGQINATRCEAVSSLPLSSVLLCSPHGACQSCLSGAWCVFLLPSRAYAIRVCPTLSCFLSWIRHLGRMSALLSTCSPHRACHACLPATCYILLLPFPTSFRHLCLRKVSCALPRHVISPSLPLASTRLSDAWCVFLLPSRACAIGVCPTLGCSLSWIPHLGRINATRCEAASNLCRCFRHSGASGTHVCAARSLQPPTVPAMRVCPPPIMSFSCLSHELLPSVSAQSLMRVAPARH